MSEYMTNVIYLEDSDFVTRPDGSIGLDPALTKGRPCVVMLQSMTCGYCDQARPLYDQFASQQGLPVRVCTVQMPGHKFGVSQTVAQALMGMAQAQGVPCYMVFGADGAFVGVHDKGRDVASLNALANSL
jgi:thiol-disulfide isomerase/thioredoxin